MFNESKAKLATALKRERNARMKGLKLPVRDDVTEVEYHRQPTASEIKFGHGAMHYRTFSIEECCHAGTRILKAWFVADDGLRYYR